PPKRPKRRSLCRFDEPPLCIQVDWTGHISKCGCKCCEAIWAAPPAAPPNYWRWLRELRAVRVDGCCDVIAGSGEALHATSVFIRLARYDRQRVRMKF